MPTAGSSSDEDMSHGEDENEAMEVDDQDPFDSRDPYRDDGLNERTGRGLRNRVCLAIPAKGAPWNFVQATITTG